ncbi:MAG: aldolase/citrate lyase family protein [Halobacteriales archaeon]|nr:aldolase/citrate lyase family protein [Halobacteriales archaeon]
MRERIEAEEPTIGTRVLSPWPGVIEVLGQSELYDYVEFVAEYGPWDLHDLENIGRAAELAGMSSMIKVDGENRAFIAQRAMSAGIQNLLFADVRDVEDAQEAIDAVRAEPQGENGVRMDRRNGYVGGYASPGDVVDMCEDAVIAIMVEKESTVENLEEILALGEIDMVQFGPSDYSLSIDMTNDSDAEEVKQAEITTIETALDMGVAPRAEISHPSQAEWYLDRGVRDFNLNTDVTILHNFWKEQGGALADELADVSR